jgi:glycosyltransferase involved in cell wall biosynthesis
MSEKETYKRIQEIGTHFSQIAKAKIVFISWVPNCSRSDILAARFGGKSYLVYCSFLGSNYFTVWLKYLLQAIYSLRILFREWPQVTFVMSPPIIACVPVWLYAKLTSTTFIIDSHKASFALDRRKPLLFIHRFLSRQAATTIITNEYLQSIVNNWQAHTTILSDVPMEYQPKHIKLPKGYNAVFVCSFNPDEPTEAMLRAVELMPDIHCYFTGNLSDVNPKVLKAKPPIVELTDFLPPEKYAGLLQASDMVISLTEREHTMQSAAYEAISLGTPVVTSDWPILRRVFKRGAVFVDNTPEGIAAGVRHIMQHRNYYQNEVRALGRERQKVWQTVKQNLHHLITNDLLNG